MAKITEFTRDQMVELTEKYLDMMIRIEDRALEIAKNMKEIDCNWHTVDVCFVEDYRTSYVRAVFGKHGEEKVVNFDIDWLFSDDHLKEVKDDHLDDNQDDPEYKEYLRLKEKFKGGAEQ